MTKEALLEQIKHQLESIKPLLKLQKIEIRELKIDLEEIKHEILRDSYNWLREFINNPIAELLKIWDLMPEERWNNYFMHELYDFREMILLAERRKVVKEYWLKRPKLLKVKSKKKATWKKNEETKI